MTMNDVFDEAPVDETAGQSKGEQQQPDLSQGQDAATGATPATENTEKHVPLAALEAERGQRKDWKEKALRYEGEIAAMRREREQQPAPQPREPQDPLQAMQQQMLHERFNTSEMLAKEKYPDLEEMVAIFQEASAQDPTLQTKLLQQAHPYAFVHKEATRIKLQREMGDDPEAYKQKVREQMRAELLAEQGNGGAAATPAAPPLPTSLAGARSAGARGSTWSGPPALDAILPN